VKRLAELAAGALVALGAVAFVQPAALPRLADSLMVEDVDLYAGGGDTAGTLFLVTRAMLGETGRNTALLGWPGRGSLGMEFLNPLVTDLIAGLAEPLGLLVGFNLAMVLLLISNGLATQLAVRIVGGSRAAGVFASGLAATSPLVVNEILEGRPVTAWWAPALAASALCVGSLQSWRRMPWLVPGLAALWIALEVYPYGPALLAPWTVLAGLAVVWRARLGGAVRGLLGALAACAVGWWWLQESGLVLGAETFDQEVFRAQDADFRSIRYDNLFFWKVGGHHQVRVPLSLTAGALAFGLTAWRRAWAWAPALVGGGWLLLMGLGPDHPPYAWTMDHVPWLRGCYRPDRFVIPATLVFAVAFGAALGQGRGLRRTLGWGMALYLGWWVAVQARPALAPWFLRWPAIPALAPLEGEVAVVDLPLVMKDEKGEMMMAVALPVPRANPTRKGYRAWRQRFADRPLLDALASVHEGGAAEPLPEVLPSVQDGLRYAVLHRAALDASEARRWKEALVTWGAQLDVEGDTEIWRLPGG